MSKRCYYEVLGVQRTVDDDELKSAFRKLALKWHPDRNRGDASSESRFKEINEAYEILKDPEKRVAYDRFGHAAFEPGGATPPARVWRRFWGIFFRSVRRHFRNGLGWKSHKTFRRPAPRHANHAGRCL